MRIARALDLDNAILWVPWVWVAGEAVAVVLLLAAAWRVLR